MNEQDKTVSRKAMRYALYWAGHIDRIEADDATVQSVLFRLVPNKNIDRLHSYVGSDGLWAAQQLLNTHAR